MATRVNVSSGMFSNLETISKAIRIYYKEFAKLWPIFFTTGLINRVIWNSSYSLFPDLILPYNFGDFFFSWLINYLFIAIPIIAIMILFNAVISAFSNAITISFISSLLRKKQTNLRKEIRLFLTYASSLIPAVCVVCILTITGFIIFIIPGIIIAVLFSITAQVLIIEQVGILESLRKSNQLMVGKWWKTFFLLLALFVISFVVWIIAFVFEGEFIILNIKFGWIISTFTYSLVEPILPIVLTLHYYSLCEIARIQKLVYDSSIVQSVKPKTPIESEMPYNFKPRFCFKCGQRLPLEAFFCPECGRQILSIRQS